MPVTLALKDKNKTSKLMIILVIIVGFLIIGIGGYLLGVKSSENTISPKLLTTELNCPQIDEQSNIIDISRSYKQEDLIPIESRITAAFRFLEDNILFYKYYPGSSNFVSEKGYDTISGVQIPQIIYPDSNNRNFFISKLSLPHVFSPYPPDTWREQKITPPLYSDFFGMLLVVSVNGKFYFLSGGSCSYGQGICYQKLVSMNSKGYKVEDIEIPSDYSPIIDTWTGGQEGGISNVNTFFEDIVKIRNTSIIFKTAKNNDIPSKYVVLDTADNTWSETNDVVEKEIKYPYDVYTDYNCISYATSLGDFVIKKDKGVEEGKHKIGLYFLKK